MSHSSLYETKDERGNRQIKTLVTLLPYLWPVGQWSIRGRVVVAFMLLVGSKIANVYVPLFYRDAVDALSGFTPVEGATLAAAVPVGLLLSYGGARVLAQMFSELREAVFARVAQRAIRNAALRTFQHLHVLSLRFHMNRITKRLNILAMKRMKPDVLTRRCRHMKLHRSKARSASPT
jgi:ATP-binding cassette subfamily B protein